MADCRFLASYVSDALANNQCVLTSFGSIGTSSSIFFPKHDRGAYLTWLETGFRTERCAEGVWERAS